MTFGPASQLGVSLFDETPPVEWVPGRSEEEAEIIIRAVYRQVLGNAYVMESERLTVPESQFKHGNLNVREFIRAVAKSDLYSSRFFSNCARYRAIELNFRHLLGRPPLDLEEMRMHSTILDDHGFGAEIDSYLDSAEYQDAFGENSVPTIRGYKTEACQSMVQFTHTFQLVRGASSSSLKGNAAGIRPRLNALVINSIPAAVSLAATSSYATSSMSSDRLSSMSSMGMVVGAGAAASAVGLVGGPESISGGVETTPYARLGVALFDETPPVEWVPGRSEEEAETIIRAVYRQVLGNAYVMESERLTVPESQFKHGNLNVREFVRAVAKSDMYMSRFFTSCARYRSIELNFRHLLGRPPLDLEEMRMHSTILDTEGFGAEIDSYIDSAEYQETFGENVVPTIRGYKTEACQSMVQFTHTFELVRGASSSSLKGNRARTKPRLNALVINSTPTNVISPAMAFARGGGFAILGGASITGGEDTKPFARLGVALFDETPPIVRQPDSSNEDLETIIRATYRQVLGNAYVMESERLTVPESQFKEGKLSVREFVRAIAKSDLYMSRFFTSCARYRATELNFRHLLGRAPLDLEEMRMHSTILDTQGFEADIDSYIDSAEYQKAFGEDTVPTIRGYKTEACESMVQFTHTFQLVRGASSSSLKGNLAGIKPRLNALVINATPTAVISPASDGATFQEPADSSRTIHGVAASGKIFRIEVAAYRSNAVNRVSKFRRSNRVYLVPFDQLSENFKKIHREGGVIASITAVN
jgi:hypothetical protein